MTATTDLRLKIITRSAEVYFNGLAQAGNHGRAWNGGYWLSLGVECGAGRFEAAAMGDAALCASAVLAVVKSYHFGLGGDAFGFFIDMERRIFVLNGRRSKSPRLHRQIRHGYSRCRPGTSTGYEVGQSWQAGCRSWRMFLRTVSMIWRLRERDLDPPIGAGLKLGMPREILAVLGVIVCFAPRVTSVWQQWNLPRAG